MKQMHELAAMRGGTCLSTERGCHTKPLRWRCGKGHEWESLLHNIKAGHWCPVCGRISMSAKKKKRSIEDLKKIVRAKGGEILSSDSDYVTTMLKLRFRCEKGHEWETRPSVIKSGHWCPACMVKGRKKFDVSALHEIAAKRGGLLLSETNMGFKVKHRWQCAQGHEWEAFPWAVKNGNWCPVCARRGRPPGAKNKEKGLPVPPSAALTHTGISPKIL